MALTLSRQECCCCCARGRALLRKTHILDCCSAVTRSSLSFHVPSPQDDVAFMVDLTVSGDVTLGIWFRCALLPDTVHAWRSLLNVHCEHAWWSRGASSLTLHTRVLLQRPCGRV